MAVVKILDTFSVQSALKKKTILAIWDFSNAFCTIIHSVIMKIAKRYNLSERMLKLLSEFLEQSFSTIKMSDKNGFYRSDEIHTECGGQQGQIGSDFVFALANENIDPEVLFDEFIERIKYVDDFNDIMASMSFKELLKSLKHNIELLLKMATSVGLKLNDDKTQFMCAHLSPQEVKDVLALTLPEDKIEDAYNDSLSYTHKLLGFNFSITNSKVNISSAVDALIQRLNGCCRIVNSMRKHGSTLEKTKLRVDVATKLVWASCYDIGLCYAYGSNPQFERISIAIRKVIKSAGLDWLTNRDIIYKISTGLPPGIMAKKQIVQLGLKFLDIKTVQEHRYNIPKDTDDPRRPFWSVFSTEYSRLPLKLRKSVIDSMGDNEPMEVIKHRLKTFYAAECYPEGVTASKIDNLISKNIYSRVVVEARKRRAEIKTKERDYNTPTRKSQLLSSISNRKLLTRCLAPKGRLPPKRKCIRVDSLGTTQYRKRPMYEDDGPQQPPDILDTGESATTRNRVIGEGEAHASSAFTTVTSMPPTPPTRSQETSMCKDLLHMETPRPKAKRRNIDRN